MRVSYVDSQTVEEEFEVMKSKFVTVVIAVLALMLCGTAMLSYAQQNDGTSSSPKAAWAGHRHSHMGYMARELNLTDAQKQQIKTIMQSQKATMSPLMQQLATNRKAMLQATANGAYNQAQVTAIASQQAQLMAQMTVQKQALQHQIYTQVLTSDQRAKADELRQKQISRIDQHMQKWSQSGSGTAEQ